MTGGCEEVEVVLDHAYGQPQMPAYPPKVDARIISHIVEYLTTGRAVERALIQVHSSNDGYRDDGLYKRSVFPKAEEVLRL